MISVYWKSPVKIPPVTAGNEIISSIFCMQFALVSRKLHPRPIMMPLAGSSRIYQIHTGYFNMKISGNNPIFHGLQNQSSIKSAQPAGQEFGRILQQTLDNSQVPQPTTMGAIFVNPLAGIQTVNASMPNRQSVVSGTEDMINLLDRYREQLADPRVPLKEIDPVIQEISREMENLTPVLESLPDGDGLKTILNRALVTASMEISKFYRGDYISA